MRKLIRAAAKGAVAPAVDVHASAPSALPPAPSPRAVPQSRVRALLCQKTVERRGLAAELARTLGVARAQVARF